MEAIRWLLGLIQSLMDLLTKPPAEYIVGIAALLNSSTAKFLDTVASSAYQRLQGAFVGLSEEMLQGIVVVMVVVAAFSALGNSSKWWRRLARGIGGYILLFLLFAPVGMLLYQASEALHGAVYTLGRTKRSAIGDFIGKAIGDIALLGGIEHFLAQLFTAFSAWLIKFELDVFNYVGLALLLLYPIVLLLQPFGKGARALLHITHASFITVVVAPPVMSLVILGPNFLSLIGLGGKGTAQAIAMVVCMCAAAVVPFFVWRLARKGSMTVVGKVEAAINGKVTTEHTGEVTAKIKDEPGPVRSLVTTVGFGTLGLAATSDNTKGSFSEGMRRVAADGVAAALTGAGHPGAAGLVQGVDAARRKRANAPNKASKSGGYQPPTPQPPPPQKPPYQPPTPQPPPGAKGP